MIDYPHYDEYPTDELAYGRCANCAQLDELGPGNLCLICEGQEREGLEVTKDYYGN